MRFETSVDIDAAESRVWDVWMDVERWPEWTRSISKVERIDAGPLAVGSRVRIKQPRLPSTVWTVTELEPQQRFAWKANAPGLTTTAVHRLIPRPPNGVTAILTIEQRGLLDRLATLVFGGLTRRYVQMEADGVKRRSEAT